MKAYKRIQVKAGNTERVNIELTSKAFFSFNDNTQSFEVRPGKYQILYGSSSDDKDLQTIQLEIK